MNALYDKIGLNYANLRQPDARIAKRIEAALGNARTVLNVGAGAGSYEPCDRQVTALEPSNKMIQHRIVFLTYDPSFRGFWLTDYFPALITLDEEQMPNMDDFGRWLGSVEVSTVPIPHNCTDGFLAGYWRRPAAYLDKRVRAAMSSFWALGDVAEGLKQLQADLENGVWEQRYSHLLGLDEMDCGYRMVVTT